LLCKKWLADLFAVGGSVGDLGAERWPFRFSCFRALHEAKSASTAPAHKP
jgi:hypothetical protein